MEKHNGYFKKIDFVFFNAGKIRELVKEAKMGASIEHNTNGSGVSDPTAAEAMHNMMPIRFITLQGNRLEWPERWLHVVDMVYLLCDEFLLSVLRAKYNNENYKTTCRRLSIAQSTHSKMIAKIKHYQELCAVQEGLIRIF